MEGLTTNQIGSLAQYRALGGAVPLAPTRNEKVQTEFLTLFYKEMLKQVFTTPAFGGAEESGFANPAALVNADLMAEKMAEHLVKSAQASGQWLPAAGESEAK